DGDRRGAVALRALRGQGRRRAADRAGPSRDCQRRPRRDRLRLSRPADHAREDRSRIARAVAIIVVVPIEPTAPREGVQTPLILHVVRHCDVENPDSLIYGRLAGFGLSTSGRAQAEQLATYFAGRPISAIYTSPQLRAIETG